MRKELDDLDLQSVAGGEVIMDKPHNVIGFSTTKEMFSLKLPEGVSFVDAVNYKNQLLMENEHLDEAGFDKLVKEKFKAKGWI